MKIIKKVSKKEFHDFLYYGMNLEDKNLYEELCDSQQFIFQFSGNTASRMIRQVKPKNFEEVIAVNSISRPGSSSMLEPYIIAKDTGKRKYPKVIADLFEETYGTILFQEQTMKLGAVVCGYTPKQTNELRGILKKLGKANPKQEDVDKWNNVYVKDFESGFKRMGLSNSETQMVLKDVVQLAKYNFNRSHAMAYSYIGLTTVYLSKYFRNYYYSASLTYDASKKDELKDSIKKVEERGYKINPPDVNSSLLHFSPEGMTINFGLNDIKGVGEQPVIDLIKNRPYSSVIDFITKNIDTSVNKRIVTALIGGGAFDNLIDGNRTYYTNVIEKFYAKKKTTKTIPLLLEKWDEAVEETEKVETTPEEYMNYEDTYLGGQFFHNAFSAVADKIEKLYSKGYCLRDFEEIRQKRLPKQYCFVYVNSYRNHTDKNGNAMCFMNIEDRNGEKADIPIFASYWKYCGERFSGEGFYLMDLYAAEEDKIMFGSSRWIKDPNTIKNMMARVPNV